MLNNNKLYDWLSPILELSFVVIGRRLHFVVNEYVGSLFLHTHFDLECYLRLVCDAKMFEAFEFILILFFSFHSSCSGEGDLLKWHAQLFLLPFDNTQHTTSLSTFQSIQIHFIISKKFTVWSFTSFYPLQLIWKFKSKTWQKHSNSCIFRIQNIVWLFIIMYYYSNCVWRMPTNGKILVSRLQLSS